MFDILLVVGLPTSEGRVGCGQDGVCLDHGGHGGGAAWYRGEAGLRSCIM